MQKKICVRNSLTLWTRTKKRRRPFPLRTRPDKTSFKGCEGQQFEVVTRSKSYFTQLNYCILFIPFFIKVKLICVLIDNVAIISYYPPDQEHYKNLFDSVKIIQCEINKAKDYSFTLLAKRIIRSLQGKYDYITVNYFEDLHHIKSNIL